MLKEGVKAPMYDTWHELVPAVFGVSTAEFEQGWQAYLQVLK